MDLISVIVPIYNIEKYLNKCIESIVNQTYKNLEIILVDDGSTDSCPTICDKWGEKDSRIIVVHKNNGGLSSARNLGLRTCLGEYVIFIDGDDYISINCFECLYQAIKNNCCQIAVGGMVQVGDRSVSNYRCSNSISILSKEEYWNEYYKSLFTNKFFSGVLINGCCKLIEKSLLDNIEFPVGRINEDTFTTYKIFDKVNKAAVVNYPLYFYVIRETSISHKSNKVEHFDILDALQERLNYFITLGNEKLIKYAFIDLLDNQIERYLTAKLSYKNIQLANNIKKSFDHTYKRAKKFKAFSNELYKKRGILYNSFYINEYIFRLIRKILRKTKAVK